MPHQKNPSVGILGASTKEAWRLLGFHWLIAKIWWEDGGITDQEMREKWPSSPPLDEAFTIEMGEDGIIGLINRVDTRGDTDNNEEVTRSMKDVEGV